MAAHNSLRLEGKRFTRLVAIKRVGTDSHEESLWECKCDCGATMVTTGNRLKSGNTKSCGCYHKIRTRELFSKPDSEIRVNRILHDYTKSAGRKRLSFSLTRKQFARLMDANCHYCGGEPKNSFKQHGKQIAPYQGIDRVDNQQGYHVGNVVPCCMVCNKMKKAMPQGEFLNHIQKIHERCVTIREMCA